MSQQLDVLEFEPALYIKTEDPDECILVSRGNMIWIRIVEKRSGYKRSITVNGFYLPGGEMMEPILVKEIIPPEVIDGLIHLYRDARLEQAIVSETVNGDFHAYIPN